MGPLRVSFGTPLVPLWYFGSPLGPLCNPFGSPLGRLGFPLGRFGSPLDPLWDTFASPLSLCVPFGSPLCLLWVPFGSPWVSFGSDGEKYEKDLTFRTHFWGGSGRQNHCFSLGKAMKMRWRHYEKNIPESEPRGGQAAELQTGEGFKRQVRRSLPRRTPPFQL